MHPSAFSAPLHRLSYAQKFILISLLFTLPLVVAVGFMVEEQNVRIEFSRKEIAGARYLMILSDLFEDLLDYRLLALRGSQNGLPVEPEMARVAVEVDANLALLRPLQQRYGVEFETTGLFERLDRTWIDLRDTPITDDLLREYERYEGVISDLRALFGQVGDQSNLILDPDLDSYYVMDAVVLRLPEAQDLIARMLLLNEGLVPPRHLTADQRTELVMLAGLLQSNTQTLRRNLDTAYANNAPGNLRPALNQPLINYRGAVEAHLARYQDAARDPQRLLGTRELVDAGDEALRASFAFNRVASPALQALLQNRIDQLTARQAGTVAFALLLVTVAFLTGVRLMRSISRPLDDLHQATRRLAAGDMAARVAVTGESEVGQVGRAFNRMADDLQAGREHLEQRVEERTRELAAATREAQEARVAAEDATRAKSAFLANMSHELRTPLNAIIGYSEMLQEDARDEGYNEFLPDLEKIRTAGRHLLALINDILDLSKIEAGKMELHLERFSLSELAHEVITTITPLIEKNGNQFEVRLAESGMIFADMTKLRQSLLNLLSNAAKFTQNGRITLEIDTLQFNDGEHVRMRVSDTGIGMDADQLKKLFREFSQGDSSTTRKYGGTGLGLALSRRFCQMMGGDITVTSRPGEGSTFSIVIPRQVAELDVAEATLPTPPAAMRGTRGTVLVIDDDSVTHDLLRRSLEREGLRVVTAATGEDGLLKARALLPDLITLDVLLGGMDGWDVLSSLKADPLLAHIPVLMLTIMDDRSSGFALGAADYLTKPVDRKRLVELVGRHLRRPEPNDQAAPILVVEDDQATREMISRTMEQAGWPVESVENGRIGLERVAAQRPSLIVLDLMMPELDGFGFLEELRARTECADVPVIVVTAMDLSADDRHRLNSSAQRVLQKGAYERDLLLGEVRALATAYLR